MNSQPLSVKLISHSTHPLGTLFYVWEQSRKRESIPLPEDVEELLRCNSDVAYSDEPIGMCALQLGAQETQNEEGHYVVNFKDLKIKLWELLKMILFESVPVTENIHFTFHLQNVSVSLREQLVRHRIGSRIDDAIGVDIIPDLASSTFWSQTMRVVPKDTFATKGEFMIPESLADKSTGIPDEYLDRTLMADELYTKFMFECQNVYAALCDAGVPIEDARNVLPMAMTHGITWTLNLKSMIHIFGKRACWVAQAGLWEQVMVGMVNEICDKIHPVFRMLIQPPCFKSGKYVGCVVPQIIKERYQGRDGMPPCPLHTFHQTPDAVNAADATEDATWTYPTEQDTTDGLHYVSKTAQFLTHWSCSRPLEESMLHESINKYERLWKLNVFTGEPLEK